MTQQTPFTITNDETGASFEFPSEAAYEAALDWYNATDKEAVIAFCKARGVDLVEPTDDPYYADGRKLVDDWADRAMHCYATSEAR